LQENKPRSEKELNIEYCRFCFCDIFNSKQIKILTVLYHENIWMRKFEYERNQWKNKLLQKSRILSPFIFKVYYIIFEFFIVFEIIQHYSKNASLKMSKLRHLPDFQLFLHKVRYPNLDLKIDFLSSFELTLWIKLNIFHFVKYISAVK
jgi:hypothetical protein